MSTELEQRLRRLAADVDLDQGRAEQRARQARRARTAGRRRVLIGAVAAAAVAVVAAATGVALRDGSDGDEDDVVATADPELRTTNAALDGIEVTVTAPAEAMAGTRLWLDVVVRNESDAAVYWNAGGCAVPVLVWVAPSSSEAAVETQPGGGEEPPRWDGEVDGLGAWLGDHNALPVVQRHQPADSTGRRHTACTDDLRPEALEPGGELRHRGSVELRLPPGGLPDDGSYDLVVAFPMYGSPEDLAELPPAEVRAPLTVTDDPGRTVAGSDAAVDAFAADPRLPDWIASTAVAGRPDLVQDFGTELSWWRGAWELWVDAYWDDDRPLRMRYDPVSGEVVDVRTVSMNQAPEDEPGRSSIPDEEPDEIL